MNLNNKGWGLQELMFGLGVLFFCLFLIFILIHKNFKQLDAVLNDNTSNEQSRPTEEDKYYTSYKEIERAMISSAEKYNADIYGAELQEGDNITVTLKSLIRDQYIRKIVDIKDENLVCSGYVNFIKNGNKVSYKPYLKCGKKYKTKGYLERLDASME